MADAMDQRKLLMQNLEDAGCGAADIARFFQLEREGRVLVLAPVSTHKVSRIERDTKKLRMLWGDGYQQAVDRMDEIRAFLTPDRA